MTIPRNGLVTLGPALLGDFSKHAPDADASIAFILAEDRDDHLEPANNWAARLEWILPTVVSGYCELCRLQQRQNKSLAAFRPAEVLGIRVKVEDENWSDSHYAVIHQGNLFSDKEPLERVPYRFQMGFMRTVRIIGSRS